MKKRIILLSVLAISTAYADEFYESDSGVMLEETVISTTGFEESSQNTMSTVTVVTSEEIQEKNYNNVTEVLKSLGNVNMFQETALGTLVDIRGQGEDRVRSNVQVLLDGVNLNSLETNFGVFPLNSININNVERIEVIQGGGAVVYGSGTSGGVINIITKDNSFDEKTFSGNIGMKIGSYGTHSRSIGLATKLSEDLELGFDFIGSGTSGYREDTKSNNETFGLGLKYRFNEDQKVVLKYSKSDNYYQIADMLTEEELEKDREGSVTDDPKERETLRETYSIDYDYKINENINFTALTSYYRSDFDRDQSTSRSTKVYNTKENKLAFKPKVNIAYTSGSLVLGYDYVEANMLRDTVEYTSDTAIKNYDMTKTSNSIFVSNSYNISDFQIITGYRYESAEFEIEDQINYGVEGDNFDKSHNNSAYDAGLNYHFSDSGKVYAKLESGYTLPDPRQYVNLEDSVAVLNDLKNESFMTYELGFQNYIVNTLVKAAVFSTNKKDEITSEETKSKVNGQSVWSTSYFNLETTRRSGGELSLSHSFNKLTVSESLSYVDAVITEGEYQDKKIPYVSPFTAAIDAVYDIDENLDFGINLTYKDEYYVDKANEGGTVNNIFVMNINSNYYITKDLKVYAGINNLLNHEYSNRVNYDSSEDEYSYDPAPETNYFVGFNYNF